MYVEKHFHNWHRQYNRMIRWYKRFKEIDQGKKEEKPNFLHDHDIVYAFFQNCFHLKDWIKNDPLVTLPKKEVEDFINKNDCLKLCSDIANGTKHLKLDQSRIGISPTIDPLSVTSRLLPDGTSQEYKIKYRIETTSGFFDAFEVATQCVQKWKEFVDKYVIPATKKPSMSDKKPISTLWGLESIDIKVNENGK